MSPAEARAVLRAAIIPDEQMWQELKELVEMHERDPASASSLLGIFLQQFSRPSPPNE